MVIKYLGPRTGVEGLARSRSCWKAGIPSISGSVASNSAVWPFVMEAHEVQGDRL